jgi:exonuclease SbcC
MIPRTLEIKNFLSYGEQIQTVDFKDYSLICLSGKNGNGKSALLDAMTWAIWGQARKTSGTAKADEGLLRLGQTRMMVSLEFEFNWRIYRVRREYAKTYGKPYASLDFEVFDGEKNKFISLTDKTIRTTQAKIEQLIGLDFETFTNSAFLRQGQSNEFSKKSPKERKQIIASILGFARYDALQSKALEQSKIYIDEKKILQLIQERYTVALATKDELIAATNEEIVKLNTRSQDLTIITTRVLEKEKERLLIEQKKQEYAGLVAEKTELEKNYSDLLVQFKALITTWRNVHAKSLQMPDPALLEKQRRELLTREKEMTLLHQKSLALQESILKIKDAYQKHYTQLKTEADKKIYELRLAHEKKDFSYKAMLQAHDEKAKQIQSLAQQIKILETDHANLQLQMQPRALAEIKLEADKLQFEKRRATYQTLVQRGNWIKKEISELEHKKLAVQDLSNPSCPLCEQVLTIKRKQFLSSHLAEQEHFLRHRFNRLSNLIKKLKELLLNQHQDIAQQTSMVEHFIKLAAKDVDLATKIKTLQDEHTSHQANLEQLFQQITLHTAERKADGELLADQEKIFLQLISSDSQIQAYQKEIADLSSQRETLAYNPELFQYIQAEIKRIEEQQNSLETLELDQSAQQERKFKISSIKTELRRTKTLCEKISAKIEFLNTSLQSEQLILSQREELLNQQKSLIEAKEESMRTVSRLESEQKALNAIKEDFDTNQAKITSLELEIEDYSNLALAFGKNGIQALLIEEAIPEIEREANTILARLTDNQSQIFIESLRDLKNGGVKETLDIQISDTAGIRPYEMFSGGEAFRVDFALRIAISKLLARRSGTALQTLIIDEGFGSQDEEGLARIMEAIYSIQNDFSKIIIVSHLPEFKDNFPAHFVIEKGSSGSIIRIEERG